MRKRLRRHEEPSRDTRDGMPLPVVGATVRIVDERGWLEATVFETDADSIHIEVPGQADVMSDRSGTHGLVWGDGRALWEVDAELQDIGLWQYRARPVSAPRRVQRRRAVRVKASVPIRLKMGSVYVHSVTTDLSEGGASLRTSDDVALEAGQQVLVTILLDSQQMVMTGTIVRVQRTAKGDRAVAVKFDPSRHTETIRRWVFSVQLRQRA